MAQEHKSRDDDDDDDDDEPQQEPAHTADNHNLLERLHAGDPSLTEISLDKQSVKSVNLKDVAVALSILSGHVSSVRLIDVGSLGDAEAALLEAISNVQVLQHLTLQGTCLTASSVRLLTLSSSSSTSTKSSNKSNNNETLQSLSLRDNPKLGPRGVKYLAQSVLPQLTALTRLNLRGIAMGHFGAQAVGTALPICLKELDISHNNIGSDGLWKMAARLSCLVTLQVLKLQHNSIQDDGCLELARRLPDMPRLKLLQLDNNDIGNVGLTELAQHVVGHGAIRELHLAGNRVSDVGAMALANVLSTMKDLRVLNLSGNLIGDQGASALAEGLLPRDQDEYDNDDESADDQYPYQQEQAVTAESPSAHTFSHLEELNLSRNQVGDEGAGTFVEHLDEIPSLMVLNLTDNDALSEGRLKILDMLLKHRTSTLHAPRLHSPRQPPPRHLDTTTTATAIPLAPLTPGPERSDNGPFSPASIDRQDDSKHGDGEEIIDPDVVAEGRKILQSISWESEQADDGDGRGDSHNIVNLSADYVSYLTNHYAKAARYGAFGPLYKATDDFFPGQDLVVQRVTVGKAGAMEAVRQTVWDEILTLATPTLLPVLARSQSVDSYSLVYDVTGGTTLYDLMKDEAKRRTLTWEHRVRIVQSVARALDYLHAGGPDRKPLFHGDVHPSNIYVSSDYATVQLSGAGWSRLVATDRGKFRSGDVVFGARAYRCPRYERGSCAYDASSDMFSLGVVLAELVTGQLQRSKPNESSGMAYDVYYEHIVSEQDIATDVVAGPIPVGILQSLEQVMISCMSPIPVRRPTANTVVNILKAL